MAERTRKRKATKRAPAGRSLAALRDDVARIDGEILERLAERRRLAVEIVGVKDAAGAAVRDTGREEDLLVALIEAGRGRGLDAHFVTKVFHEIIADSLRQQQDVLQRRANPAGGEPEVVRVAFQGIAGAYSYLAAKQFFAEVADRLAFLPCATFAAVVAAVENGQADHAMLPIENTTSGGINEVYDLLLHTRLAIVGEVKFRVEHCLVGAADVPLAALRRIYSHPQAVAQCTDFLASLPHCKVEFHTDTAEAVTKVRDDGDPSQAAIASEQAAAMYGLAVLRKGIANQRENYTRFLVAARSPRTVDPRIPCKTSLVMATAQKPGALVEALLVFREAGINLTKLESRPILGNPWEEMFYLDFSGSVAEERVQRALDELTRSTRFLKVLGSYPSQELPPTEPSPEKISRARVRAGKAPKAAAAAAPASTAGAEKRGYRLASRVHKSDDTIIEVKGVRLGGDGFTVIAGPCAVESREQIMASARAVRESGGRLLRGGCFKPRIVAVQLPGARLGGPRAAR